MTSTKAQPASGPLALLADIAKTAMVALVLSMVPRTVLCQPFTIPSESMEPTLLVGDYIVVSKYAYGWSRHSLPLSPPLAHGRLFGREPHRGDIVVFKEPRDPKADIIKRLVGLPGDRLQVIKGALYLNGQPVERQATAPAVEQGPFGTVAVAQYRETLPNGRSYLTRSYGPDTQAGNTGVYVVPEGCYFMMGDNRDNSQDSRFNPGPIPASQTSCAWDPELDRHLPPGLGMGYVPFDDFVGRADMVLLSWKPGVSLLKPWTLVGGVRWDRSFHKLGA